MEMIFTVRGRMKENNVEISLLLCILFVYKEDLV